MKPVQRKISAFFSDGTRLPLNKHFFKNCTEFLSSRSVQFDFAYHPFPLFFPLRFLALFSSRRRYLWIGCADARVPANELMGEGAGTVFVHRNVGNQVLNTDVSLMSTLQYAVDHLQARHTTLPTQACARAHFATTMPLSLCMR
jgi:hypothetical protein